MVAAKDSNTNSYIKVLCSYNGKILPRYPDGKLRYQGGHTRILSLPRCISFNELMQKIGELTGDASMSLRCQLPSEDLDALVSITSDEDLANLIEEYEKAADAASSLKIRAFLLPKLIKKVSPPSSVSSPPSSNTSPVSSIVQGEARCPAPMPNRCYRSRLPAVALYHPVCYQKSSGRVSPPYGYSKMQGYVVNGGGCGGHAYLVHNGNHWQ